MAAAWGALSQARTGRERLVEAQAAARRQDAATVRRAAAEAASSFQAADQRLRSPALVPFRFAPVLDRNIAVARALAASGGLAARAADRLAGAVEARPAGGWAVGGGRIDLEALMSASERLAAVRDDLGDARRFVQASPSSWLVGPVSRLRRQGERDIVDAEKTAASGATGLDLAVRMLGGAEPRRYYVAMGSLSELRGTGAFMGLFGTLDAAGGKLSFQMSGRPNASLPPPSTVDLRAPRWYVMTYARHAGTRLWANINVSPDFPTVGALIARALEQPESIGHVDGVIGVDPLAAAELLRATGPISVPSWPEPIDATNVSRVSQFEAYARFGAQSGRRTDFLASLSEAIFQRVLSSGLRLDEPTLAGLGQAAAGGHIQVYATRPEEERVLRELGLARGVDRARDATDVLGVVTENWSPSKIDWFLRRRVSYEVRLNPGDAGREVQGRLRLELRNEAPPAGFPDYILGTNAREVPYAHNRQLLLLLRPPEDQLHGELRVDGVAQPVSGDRERELRNYSRFVTIAPGGRAVVEADFDVPGGLRGTGRERVYRLHVLRQPVAHPDAYSVRIVPPKGWKVEGRTTFDGPLHSDLVLEVRLEQTVRALVFDAAVLRPFRLARALMRSIF